MAKEALSEHLSSLRIDDSHRGDDRRPLPRWIWIVLVILTIAGGAWAAANALRSPEVETARVVSMETREQSTVLVASGYAVAHHKISVSSKVMGKVAWVGVEKGDIVRKDQVLVRLENLEFRAQVLQAQGNLAAAQAHYDEWKNGSRPEEIERAKAQVAQGDAAMRNAKIQLDRNIALSRDGVVSKSDLDNAQANYDSAKANFDALGKTYDLTRIGNRREEIENARALVDQARGQLDYAKTQLDACEIRSPVNGTVLDRLVEMGEMVTTSFVGDRGAKSSVVSLADLDDLLVELDINQNDFARVTPKQSATVVADAYPDHKYQGQVFEISPEANRQKGTVQVKVKVLDPDGKLRPEMNAKVSFHSSTSNAVVRSTELTVPKSAVFQADGKQVVAAVADGRVSLKPVTLGDSTGETIRITAGLTGSETVVVANPSALHDGQRVRTK